MTDPQITIRREGDPAFPIEERETTTPEPEATVEEPVAPATAPAAVPFNEDPKVQEYIERQVSTRIGDVEKKLREEFTGNAAAIREEIGKQREKNATDTKIPAWFGGNQEQWNDYRGWLDGQLGELEERAVTKTFERATTQATDAQKRVDEATDYFRGEIAAITADKDLNPSGKAIDPQKLLKVALDNDLVDSKGRWNYRAAVRLMNSHPTAAHAPKTGDKNLAGATMEGAGAGGSAGEATPKPFKTAKDFAKKRPW